MQNYPITSGVVSTPVKVVLYGPEGIGKSTLASRFPKPLFLDTEDGTKRLDVRRLPRPESWTMLLDEVRAAAELPCGTLVLDTADWAEQLCAAAVCARGRVSSIEGFGYGKGYVYLKEEFARLLAALDGVVAAGRHVVVTAHAQITRFEQPDELGSYDRWTMKTSRQVAPLLREWCDALLFANYKTFVVKDGDGKSARGKAQGGRRVLYTAHHPCWDAKNRFGLPDELPMDFSSLAGLVQSGAATHRPTQTAAAPSAPAHTGAHSVDGLPHTAAATAPAALPAAQTPAAPTAPPPTHAGDSPAPSSAHTELYARMRTDGVGDAELRRAVHDGGYYPEDMPIADYPASFVSERLLARWAGVVQAVTDSRDIPF